MPGAGIRETGLRARPGSGRRSPNHLRHPVEEEAAQRAAQRLHQPAHPRRGPGGERGRHAEQVQEQVTGGAGVAVRPVRAQVDEPELPAQLGRL